MNQHLAYLRRQLPDHEIDWVASTTSTQTEVRPNALLITEHQSAGVGRQGRVWLTPQGRSVCLSYRFELALTPKHLSGYALGAAIATLQTLQHYQSDCEVSLKWPNDLHHRGQKFAGILINLVPKNPNKTEVILGLGLNWNLLQKHLDAVNQAVCNVPLAHKPERSDFIARLIQRIDQMNQHFIQHGWVGPDQSHWQLWQAHDALCGHIVRLVDGKHSHEGHCHGVNQAGQLLIESDNQILAFSAGEASVRSL